MKRYKFKVKPKHKDGALDFPMDMLRYDRCYPVTLEDSMAIKDAVVFIYGSNYPDYETSWKGTIELQSNDRQPSSKAWESYGWLVCSCESFKQ